MVNGNLRNSQSATDSRTLNVDAAYGRYHSVGNNYQPNEYRDPIGQTLLQERNYRMKTATSIDLYTLKADYEQRLRGGKVSAGFKVSRVSLPDKWNIEVSGYYTSPSIWGSTFLNGRYWGTNVGVSRKVIKDRGSLVVILTDPFNSQRWRGISECGGLYMDASGGYESRQLRLNFTYNFGSRQVKAARQRKAGSDDENKRIN